MDLTQPFSRVFQSASDSSIPDEPAFLHTPERAARPGPGSGNSIQNMILIPGVYPLHTSQFTIQQWVAGVNA